jgi:hypothetical protein
MYRPHFKIIVARRSISTTATTPHARPTRMSTNKVFLYIPNAESTELPTLEASQSQANDTSITSRFPNKKNAPPMDCVLCQWQAMIQDGAMHHLIQEWAIEM